MASFLTILPAVIWDAIIAGLWPDKVSPTIAYRISYTFAALYLFNPILNPLIYALRMHSSGEQLGNLSVRKKNRINTIEPVESLAM